MLEKEARRIASLLKKKAPLTASLVSPTTKQPDASGDSQDIQTVDVNSLNHQDARHAGGEYLGYHAAKQLNLPKLLADLGFNHKQVNIALASIIGRLVHQGSELSTHLYLTEHSALEEMLQELHIDEKATVVMDAGIATEENVSWLKAHGYEYIVVTRKQNLTLPEEQVSVIVKEDKTNLVRASLVTNEASDEMELYCHSSAKEEKTKQMQSKARERFETELQKLSNGLTKKGCSKKYDKVIERIGRLKERYAQVAKTYEITVDKDESGKNAQSIQWKYDEGKQGQWGVYCLRTNRKDLDEPRNRSWARLLSATD